MPMNKATAASYASKVKTQLDRVEVGIAALPSSPEKELLIPEMTRLHTLANGGAVKLGEHFGEPAAYFSGGTDKPYEV